MPEFDDDSINTQSIDENLELIGIEDKGEGDIPSSAMDAEISTAARRRGRETLKADDIAVSRRIANSDKKLDALPAALSKSTHSE